MNTDTNPRIYLNPECPRFATTPVNEDGTFDNDSFGKLIGLQNNGGTVNEFINVMLKTEMEDTPLVRQRQSVLRGEDSDAYECHPATWAAMPEDFREKFVLVESPA